MEDAVAAAQQASLSHPLQAQIKELTAEVQAAKTACNQHSTPENIARRDMLVKQRAELTERRDDESGLTAAKAAAREIEQNKALSKALAAADALAGLTAEQLAAEDAQLREQLAGITAKRRALSAARVRTDLEGKLEKLKSELSPLELQLLRERGEL